SVLITRDKYRFLSELDDLVSSVCEIGWFHRRRLHFAGQYCIACRLIQGVMTRLFSTVARVTFPSELKKIRILTAPSAPACKPLPGNFGFEADSQSLLLLCTGGASVNSITSRQLNP